ncbi:AlbA family DNA-binding domain-containing protein [Saccharibacillus endophyticus]|uniref:Schlafen AlbA-2 domain-containing protein n=1 Tax=Saccharibacillus endophyticus TaxID=2060666 RepID=A0ABQ1ZX50_9BACL|nr:ATP-binding protein [Saccharibacillus endophyticus]GGH80170.1 hypothetical protein GCM10007362_28070 [Saccharibacillus endophyticus]
MVTYSKKMDEINLDEIKQIEEFNMKEDQYHEFKSEFPHPDSFCAAITSFANSHGGDLFLGIDAPENADVVLKGITTSDSDKELLKYMNILQNGVEPKLPNVESKVFKVDENKYVFLFRIKRSSLRPHRVKNSGKFYSRKSNGKFPLDVFELRKMFNESDEFSEKINRFREERALHYYAQYPNQSFMLIQLIPVSCFENRNILDLSLYDQLSLKPLASAEWNPRINFNGIVSTARNHSITQIFRNGIIEGFTIRLTRENKIASLYFVQKISEFVHQNIRNYELMEMVEPFYISVSLFGVSGHEFIIDGFSFDTPEPLNEDVLVFPEILIEGREDVSDKLNIIYDALWNAFGFKKYPQRTP